MTDLGVRPPGAGEHLPHQSLRHDWTFDEVRDLLRAPFNDLLFAAQKLHRAHFDPNQVQKSRLMSIKTGGCPEDCAYCNQSAHFETGLAATRLAALEDIAQAARQAKAEGATRFCMGAAWREPKDRDMDELCLMVEEIKSLGMETCMTLGMLTDSQVARLRQAGLDYYNHNIDTSPDYYEKIITTRTFQDRLDTLERVRNAGINVCCGGIVGMGESEADRANMLIVLANLPVHPESVPINMLMRIEGTPLAQTDNIDTLDFVRTVAAARIMMPHSMVRLSAGREYMSEELQALCFLAGANSIFIGDELLTTRNPAQEKDDALMRKLGLVPMPAHATGDWAVKRLDPRNDGAQ